MHSENKIKNKGIKISGERAYIYIYIFIKRVMGFFILMVMGYVYILIP